MTTGRGRGGTEVHGGDVRGKEWQEETKVEDARPEEGGKLRYTGTEMIERRGAEADQERRC